MKLATDASLSFWNALPAAQRARTLALGRFTSFPLENQNGRYALNRGDTGYRRETCDAVADGAVLHDGTSAWLQFLREGLRLPDDQLLYAQLQSRLMVNMAGGVLENGGLCLDRRTGLPYIPGSAVKGCARRFALAALREWCETASKPGEKQDDKDNLLADACKPFASPAAMLTVIARVFGWCELDWKTRADFRNDEEWQKKRSDFAWACETTPSDTAANRVPTERQIAAQGNALETGPDSAASPEGAEQSPPQAGWTALRETVVRQIARELGLTIREDDPVPWKRLPNFAGSVSFLPAYPIKAGAKALPLAEPDLGAMELDVVTCHHGEYYRCIDPDAKAEDTEEPVPVVFPAIAAGHVFVFAMLPLRDCSGELLTQACTWLSGGLGTFGLGAKTAAGYGWFDTGEKVRTEVLASLQRESLKPSQVLLDEFLKWDDKQVRKAAAAFAFAALTPKTGREATSEYRFTLAKFVLEQRTALFVAQKNHAGSDFAKGVKRLAEEFKLSLP